MPRRNPHRNISRIELTASGGRRHGGWEVRIQRQGRVHSRFFSDSRWGGKRAALHEARRYRDDLESRLRPYTIRKLAEYRSARNTSGIVGVRPAIHTIDNGETVRSYRFWIAQWTDGLGRRRTRSFSVNKYGDKAAFEMALAARRTGVQRAKRTL